MTRRGNDVRKYPLVLSATDHILIRDMLADEGFTYSMPGWAVWAESMAKTFEKVN